MRTVTSLLALMIFGCASQSAPPPPPSTAELKAAVGCKSDADCHAASIYCESCKCEALTNDQQPPACEGATVQCFVSPCMKKRAVCHNAACEIVSDSSM